jgi:uncharacterized membrane protein
MRIGHCTYEAVAEPERQTREGPAADNIRAIVELERQSARAASIGERLAASISDVIGTMGFVFVHVIGLAVWLGWNMFGPEPARFDPYPFGLLTFIVSLEGVLIACFVLIAQNRMSRQSDQRDHLNLQVSLLAEQEMTLMLKLLRQISEKMHIEPESVDEARAVKLSEETNVYELVESIQRELPRRSE